MGMACSWSSNRPGKNSGVGNIGSKLQVFPVGSTPKSSPPGVPVFHWVEASGHRVATCSDCFDIACGWRSPLIGCRSHFVRDCRQSILKRCDLHEDGPDLPGRWTSWRRNFRQLQQRVGGSREAVFDRRSGRPIQASVCFFCLSIRVTSHWPGSSNLVLRMIRTREPAFRMARAMQSYFLCIAAFGLRIPR